MLYHRFASVLLLLVFSTLMAQAQAPRAAQDFYSRGYQRYTKGDLDGAIADFTQAIELSSRLDGGHHRPGKTTSEFSGGASNFDRIAVIDPLAAAAYTDRALARCDQGDLEGAINDCNRAIAINPRLKEAYLNRGLARYRQKDFDGALADFDRTLAINPRDAEAYNNRGNVRMARGDLAGALADFDQAIA